MVESGIGLLCLGVSFNFLCWLNLDDYVIGTGAGAGGVLRPLFISMYLSNYDDALTTQSLLLLLLNDNNVGWGGGEQIMYNPYQYCKPKPHSFKSQFNCHHCHSSSPLFTILHTIILLPHNYKPEGETVSQYPID